MGSNKKTKRTVILPGQIDIYRERQRHRSMLTEMHKNITSSNLNLNDSGNFYKNWLLEIHKKRQIRKHGITLMKLQK
jgi:hypothetical protein